MSHLRKTLVLGLATIIGQAPLISATADEATITVTVKKTNPEAEANPPFAGDRASVDVALLLDTSNSMDGLISQAKNQLWTIVQEFAKAKKRGQTPSLRVALFEYGNTQLPASEGYIRQVVTLTDDLDELSEALFGLKTDGGDEYCGQVINEALDRLDWSSEPNSYKAIFIAGNEPFTQGSLDYREACKTAIEAGVVINTIHCGDYESGVQGGWKDGADLAEGEYLNIDQDRKVIQIECPQDEIILKLNAELNQTYLWFGQAGERERFGRRQESQDAAAASESTITAVNRVAAKAGAAYNNRNRDLVDAFAADEEVMERVDQDELPQAMQQMTATQREEYVAEMAEKRADLQKRIANLNVEREQHIAKERRKLADESQEDTLGDAITSALRSQLVDAGFDVE